MLELLSGLLTTGVMFAVGTVAANFLLHTLRPKWSRKKHILWASMLPPFGLWLLVTSVIFFSTMGDDGGRLEFLVPVIALAVTLPFVGALVGIPTSWLILKQMGWKNSSSSVDDIFG